MRRIRIQQRKRQTWLALPASGITEACHGSSSERPVSKDRGEAKEPWRRGNTAALPARQALAELMAWSGIEEQGEAITLMIHHLHGLGPGGALPLLEPPRHEITISPSVSRKLQVFSDRQALMLRMDD